MKTAEEFAEEHQYDLEDYDEGGYLGINVHVFARLLDEYANQFKKEGDAVKTVCPKCKSDDWVGMGQYRRCNDCNERWNEGQTVL